jgi:hypothetical protein
MAHAFRYLTLALALVAPALAAQVPAAPQQSVRFTVFASRPVTDVAFAARPGATTQKLAFYPTARSPRYEFRGAMPLRFVDPISGVIVAEATVPLETRDALLLFIPVDAAAADKAGKGLRYQVAVLDDSALRHGPGGLSVINLSGLELSGNIGTHAVLLKPGLNPTLSVGRTAKIALRAAFKGKTYQSYADSVRLGTLERALLILFPPYYKGSLEAQSRLLIDEPPPVPLPGKATTN